MADTWHPALSTDCSVFCTECPVLNTDISVLNTERSAPDADISALDLCARTGRGLLRVRRLAFRAGGRISPCSTRTPCAGHRLPGDQHLARRAGYGLLHARHFALAPVTDCSVLDTWRSAPVTDFSALDALLPVLNTNCSVLNT